MSKIISTYFKNFTVLQIVFILIGSFLLNVSAQTKLPSSSIKTIYITPSSHYDFGFVEPPNAIRERAAHHIDEVIRVAEENPNFKWTIESVWQVNEWLKRQKKPTSVLPKDKEKIARLIKLIKSGKIALSMSWGSMHTDFMAAEELNRLIYDYAVLNRTYGVESNFAMLNDVPGHPTSLPSVLAGSGAKYLVTGANAFINNATSLAPGNVPFYWQSPDGNKVLTWVSQGKRGGYVEALTDFYLDPFSLDPYTDKTPFDMFNPEQAGKKTPIEVMEIGVTELLNRYNQANYKYDAVMAMYSHDFVEPTDVVNLEKAVKLWNAKHKTVQLKIATHPEFLKYIEQKYSSQIPTYKGEWSGLWSDSKTQSPRISALARYAQNHTPVAETLWSGISMTRSIPYPVGNMTSLYDLILTYDEHSGAGNNGWMQLNSSEPLNEQNRQYVEFMNEATTEVDFLMKKGTDLVAQPTRFENTRQNTPNTWNVMIYNGLSWERNDLVKLKSPHKNTKITDIKDPQSNQKVKFDTDETGTVFFIAKNVPSFGYKTYQVTTENGASTSSLKTENNKTEIKNERFQVKLNEKGNVESISDFGQKRELVNKNGELPFNDLVRSEGSEYSKVLYPVAPEISVKKGEQMSQIIVKRDRSSFPLTILTIYDDLNRVDLHNELNPEEIAFVGGNDNWHDSYHFAFPFNLSANNLKLKRGGQKWFDTLPDDFLPGARQDAVTTQHLIALTDGNNSAMVAHRQAFHWSYSGYLATKLRAKDAPKEFPAMYMGKFPLPEATLYSRAVRSSNQTDTHDLSVMNMRTVEPNMKGNYIFDYAIAGSGKFNEVEAWQLGANFNVPLYVNFVGTVPNQTNHSFFAINQPNVQIVTVKMFSDNIVKGEVSANPLVPPVNKLFVIRLQEFSGKATTAQVNLPTKIKSASILNLTESKTIQQVTQISPLTIQLNPFETKTVKIEIE